MRIRRLARRMRMPWPAANSSPSNPANAAGRPCYFAVFALLDASVTASFFLRRAARFLTLFLPLQCPIGIPLHTLRPPTPVDSQRSGEKRTGRRPPNRCDSSMPGEAV